MPKTHSVSNDIAVISTPPQSPPYHKKISSRSDGSSRTKRSVHISEKPITDRPTRQSVHRTTSRLKILDTEELRSHLTHNKEMLSALKRIDMGFTTIDIANLRELLSTTPGLKELNIWYCHNILPNAISRLPTTLFASLENIDFSFNLITNRDIQAVLPATPMLKELGLYGCKLITEGVFSTLAENSLPFLTTASLGALPLKMSDIQDLLRAAPNITELTLRNCPYLQTLTDENFPQHIKIRW